MRKPKIFMVLMALAFPSAHAMPREEFLKLPFEERSAVAMEEGRDRVQYALKNVGKKFSEIDMSKLVPFGSHTSAEIVTYDLIATIYLASCENHFKAAEYEYKDYLEWKKSEMGQPSLWRAQGGDSTPFGNLLFVVMPNKMYKEADKYYADYHDFHWMRLTRGKTVKEKKKFLEKDEDYLGFMREWREIRRLAKTVKPKPLDIQVEIHEDFYSEKREEVLKALEYYHVNKVKFMLEKALKHKDPVVAAKAKEYLEDFGKGEKDGAENKKP